MKRNQSGFTLIEIAIVLVIIGLLLGGVLKGQELINSAKVKNLAADFKNIPVFIYGYQDKFKALPGDDAAVVAHVNGTPATAPASPAARSNGIIEGEWDSTTAGDESVVFWQHVRLAGLAAGETTVSVAVGNTYIPKNAVGGTIGITNSGTNLPITGLKGSYIVCSGGIAGKFAKQLDTTMDDSATDAGSMRVLDPAAAPAAIDNATIDDDTPYTVCMGF